MSKKIQIVKLNQELCQGDFNQNDVLFVRVEDAIEDKKAEVEIRDSYHAYIIKNGSDVRFYRNGPVPVFSDKSEIKAWKKGYSVEVVYMAASANPKVNWGTPNKITYRDEASNHVISIGARGIMEEFHITNHQQFYKKVIGVRKELTVRDFQQRFIEVINDDFADCFLRAVSSLHLTYDQFDAHKKEIAAEIWKTLGPYFEETWGCTFGRFIIVEFRISDEDKEAIEDAAAEAKKQEKLKEYLAELERLDDKQWEREKYLRQLELQDRNAYYEVLKVVGNKPAGGVPGAEGPASTFCPHCGGSIKGGDIFCSKCGKRVVKETVICPNCGKSNDGDAMFCATCGQKLK